MEKRKNATPKEIENLIAEYEKDGKSREDIANLENARGDDEIRGGNEREEIERRQALKELKEAKA